MQKRWSDDNWLTIMSRVNGSRKPGNATSMQKISATNDSATCFMLAAELKVSMDARIKDSL